MADGAQVITSVTIINGLLGFQALSLTNFSTSASTAIAAGSKCEIAGAFFTFATDCTPDATSWTAITTGSTAYIALTPAGTAGNQTVSASWTETTPAWSTSKQGWYTTAGSSIRVVAGCYKTSATQYDDKFIIDDKQSLSANQRLGNIATGMTVFTSGSGNYTVPDNVFLIKVTAIGGGGGGGASSGGAGGAGGGAGGCCISKITVSPGQVIAYSVGPAATNTTFGSLTAGGGSNASTSTGGAGGTATGAIINISGATGSAGGGDNGQPGASSILGGAGPAGKTVGGGAGQNGGAAIANTGGGGGGGGSGVSGGAGGAGASGIIIIEY